MKANEFVKKVGIDAVRSYVAAYEDALTDDLKRLVESHDLVSKATPEELYQAEICEGIWCNHRLKQAIADVESCR